jgi:hypothetical protein
MTPEELAADAYTYLPAADAVPARAAVRPAARQSRPILDRVGFRTVCEIQALVDETGDHGPVDSAA